MSKCFKWFLCLTTLIIATALLRPLTHVKLINTRRSNAAKAAYSFIKWNDLITMFWFSVSSLYVNVVKYYHCNIFWAPNLHWLHDTCFSDTTAKLNFVISKKIISLASQLSHLWRHLPTLLLPLPPNYATHLQAMFANSPNAHPQALWHSEERISAMHGHCTCCLRSVLICFLSSIPTWLHLPYASSQLNTS